ncbi:acyl-CoA ligase (AMP-forming), exosortase A system-associated [Pseudoduganella sp. FT25W]|uniref:Acyl-CoA ligase (AMP-forming), exosortase A system-associated n=1 Tax=Duganella alba TaxID=2666081 RepID=A0A6L5Q9F1_9BURK|nr:acyl-CoA ligase (AMP-forming), exosortase A system-associated [Duganella alba]MRX06434.1 acyl-CoA ligase (AMP-forming), exosortase A system-associated [Duganella alba]MRX14828.1 acyl-CoA ligase (AMP-forming), exosortase A system-associated [Duganella alba]
MPQLIHEFIFQSARQMPERQALSYQGVGLNYGALAQMVTVAAHAWLHHGLGRGERLAVYLEKREENVVAMFGAAAAGAVFVPVNPVLKAEQVAYILADCNVRILVTSRERFSQLCDVLGACPDLQTVIVIGSMEGLQPPPGVRLHSWRESMLSAQARPPHPCIDCDMAAILYTSGSTGKPKGVILSHRNLVAGALSVSSYLNNTAEDRILCVLPLSFDYGLSQLTTAFAVGACAVLLNHLLLRDVIDAIDRDRITGLAGVPPLWIQLSELSWHHARRMRYITNSGGVMPQHTIKALRKALPHVQMYLMYGLTEAFRSTYLAPEQLDLRPDSIGKAIPNAEILVLRGDGSPCGPNEPGELVHRGALVSMGYWNDAARTAERFRPVPDRSGGRPIPELAVWSGDTVWADEEGYLYFIGRGDDMIKTSGYRVSPAEVEEVVYATGLVSEAAAFGVAHPMLGQVIALVAVGDELNSPALLAACKRSLPAYMVPARIDVRGQPLPRNPNGKIDRRLLAQELEARS